MLQSLLEERVPIRDMRTIAETLAAYAPRSQDPVVLTAAVRAALARSIVQNINGMAPELSVMTLDPSLEQILLQSVQGTDDGGAGIEPGLAEQLLGALQQNSRQLEMAGKPAVLLIAPGLRNWLARMVRHSIPTLNVLSYTEIPDNKQIKVMSTIGEQLPAA